MNNEQRSTAPPHLETYWQHVPSCYTDGVLGNARAGGVFRVVLGEICFNIEPGSESPASRPVMNLIMTADAIGRMINDLQIMLDGLNNEPAS